MFSYLKSFLRPLGPSNSSRSTQASSPLHAYTQDELDQYPFPFDPELVRKARHDNTPRFLPPPNAGVRDVRYFLYTLLTSKTNKCAKRYPEWALETCMAWHGDGEVLRACDEQDLLTLCPYIAVAEGIKSGKHRPGVYVPIPARHMIGEIIARFVMDRKTSENGSENIQRRLHKERTRSISSLGFHARLGSRQLGHNSGRGGSESSQLVRRRSVQSLNANIRMSCPTPAMWMASKTIYDVSSTIGRSEPPSSGFREPANMTTSPLHPINVPSSADSTDSLSPRDSVSSHLSSSTRVTSPTSFVSIDSFRENQDTTGSAQTASPDDPMFSTTESLNVPYAKPRQPTVQLQDDPYAPQSQYRQPRGIRRDSTEIPHASLPQRYAPRRLPGLRPSPTMSNSYIPTGTQPSQLSRDFPINTTSKSVHTPSRPPMQSRRRRGSLASLSRLSIPERITEELLEMPNSPDSMDQQIWSADAMNNNGARLQGTVPQVRRRSMRRVSSPMIMDNYRSSTPPLQRGIYHPSRTPSDSTLDTKSPVTLIEVIENKQRRTRKPSRGEGIRSE